MLSNPSLIENICALKIYMYAVHRQTDTHTDLLSIYEFNRLDKVNLSDELAKVMPSFA